MAVYVCRACGGESRYWEPYKTCPHCGAATFNRLTEARIRAELGVMEYLYNGDTKESPRNGKKTKRQLELFGKE